MQCKTRLAIQDHTPKWLNRISAAEALIPIVGTLRGGWTGVQANLGQMMWN